MFGRETLNLKNMETLNQEFESLISAILRSLEAPEDKASITLKMSFQLCKDSPRHMTVTYRLTPTFPARGRQILAAVDLLNNKITADEFDLGKVDIPRAAQGNLMDAAETADR